MEQYGVWGKKSQIESSNKDRPDQQKYGGQYGGKVPANDHKTIKRIKRCLVKIRRKIIEKNDNKNERKNKIRTMKTSSFLDFNRVKKFISLYEITYMLMTLKCMPKIINTRSLQIGIIWFKLTVQVIR